MYLLPLKSTLEQGHPAEAAACYIGKHVDLLIAMQSVARLLRATQSQCL